MQRIEVKNFGPLKEITLDIKDYMIFIGPQASGKSTLAKLIYFSKKIEIERYLLLVRYGATRLTQNEVSVELFTRGFAKVIREYLGIYFKDNLLPEYELKVIFNSYSITLRNNRFELSDDFFSEFSFIDKNLNRILSKQYHELDRKIGNHSIELYIENITNYNYGNPRVRIGHDRIFVPAHRYMVSLLSDRDLTDQLLVDYKLFIDHTNPYILSGITNKSDFFEHKKILIEFSRRILKGEYAYSTNSRKVLYYDEDKYVNLSEASSGQQEAVWIIETIKDLVVSLNHGEVESYDLIIEEPEAHLFPEAQRDITYLITLLANQPHTQVIITTHSPYILAALNNMIKAYIVGQEEEKKVPVGHILNPLLWVDPKMLYVGYLDQGGITDIVDEETNLIKHEMLDKVSDDIMGQFDQLLEIQYDE